MRRRDAIHADYEVKNEALGLRKDEPEAVSPTVTGVKASHTHPRAAVLPQRRGGATLAGGL